MAGSHGRRRLLLSSISVFRCQFSYSTNSSSNHVGISHGLGNMAAYLINSLGFSREEAMSATSKYKVSHPKFPSMSTANADLVVNLFKDYGLDETQIKDVVSSVPQILSCKIDRTLEPKIRLLHEMGFSGKDLAMLVKKNPDSVRVGLHTVLIPLFDYLRKLLGSHEKVVEVVKKSSWLFSSSTLKRLPENVVLLRNYGLSDEEIGIFIVKNIRCVSQKPEWITSKVDWIEGRLGITRDCPMFVRCLYAVATSSITVLEKKMEVYKSFGWSDMDISSLFSSQPKCFVFSEARIQDKLNFFMKELGHTPAYLISCCCLLTYSLEKRVKPRNEVLRILKEKMLVDSSKPLVSVATLSETKFRYFVQNYENEIPGLYEMYISSVRLKSKT